MTKFTLLVLVLVCSVKFLLVNPAPPTPSGNGRVSYFLDKICTKLGMKWSTPWQSNSSHQHQTESVMSRFTNFFNLDSPPLESVVVDESEFHLLLTVLGALDGKGFESVLEAAETQIIDQHEGNGNAHERDNIVGFDLPTLYAIFRFVHEQYENVKGDCHEPSQMLSQWLVEGLELVQPLHEIMLTKNSHARNKETILPLKEKLPMLRAIWILSATTSNFKGTRDVLLEAIHSSNISPEAVVAILEHREFQKILQAQRHTIVGVDDGCWHSGHRLEPNEVISEFIDALERAANEERDEENDRNNHPNQASSSGSTITTTNDEKKDSQNEYKSDGKQKIAEAEPEKKKTECVICLDEIENVDAETAKLPCGHAAIHKTCWDDWRSNQENAYLPVTCPVCRAVIQPRRQRLHDPNVPDPRNQHGITFTIGRDGTMNFISPERARELLESRSGITNPINPRR